MGILKLGGHGKGSSCQDWEGTLWASGLVHLMLVSCYPDSELTESRIHVSCSLVYPSIIPHAGTQ